MTAAQRSERINRTHGDGAPALDAAFLARQTFGDPALAREVLGLFAGHLQTFRGRFAAASVEARSSLLHALKGSARSVGAFPLADCIEGLELAVPQSRAAEGLDALLDATLAATARHLG